MDEETTALAGAMDKGAPLVATTTRWLAFAVGEAGAIVGLGYLYVSLSHGKTTLADLAVLLGIAVVVVALVTLAVLRSEEARLARELRTARTGTPAIRTMVLDRRQRSPMLLRALSTSLGTAAVLVAEGDRSGALDALSTASPLMAGGALQRLRAVIDADVQRASGTPAGLSLCIDALRSMEPLANREAERYRKHVLVKAVLGQADGDLAEKLYAELAASNDEDERVYAAWLRAWFEIEGPAPTDGELRLALLLARSQGAVDLAKKLEAALEPPSPLQPSPAPTT